VLFAYKPGIRHWTKEEVGGGQLVDNIREAGSCKAEDRNTPRWIAQGCETDHAQQNQPCGKLDPCKVI
jgi:hypothetical protein